MQNLRKQSKLAQNISKQIHKIVIIITGFLKTIITWNTNTPPPPILAHFSDSAWFSLILLFSYYRGWHSADDFAGRFLDAAAAFHRGRRRR